MSNDIDELMSELYGTLDSIENSIEDMTEALKDAKNYCNKIETEIERMRKPAVDPRIRQAFSMLRNQLNVTLEVMNKVETSDELGS